MAKELLNIVKLTGTNEHLLDIFSENCYLELGNIDYHVLSRLLKYEEVSYKSISSFDIENIGIGHSKINNKTLKPLIPFLYFENINHKNNSFQLFITYGLLSYKTQGTSEKFAPLVLIPVNAYINGDDVTFEMLSKPIENKVIVDKIIEKNKFYNNTIKLDSLSNIDKYVLSFDGLSKTSHVSFECFLTYASTKTVNLRIDHKSFFFHKESIIDPKKLANNQNLKSMLALNVLNKEQNQALYNAQMGHSFAINGRVGTGKTTALINIAANAIANGKKVLYVTNMKETVLQVEREMASHNLDKYCLNLCQPSNRLPKVIVNYQKLEWRNSSETLKKIANNYLYVNEYEKELFGRINDFRYNEVLTELAKLSHEVKNYLELDDLTSIYKHEYELIIDSLETIQKQFFILQSLGVNYLNQSIFNDIPITLDKHLINKNNIIQVLSNINGLFDKLIEDKNNLESQYGFNPIINYGRLGYTRNYLETISLDLIPESWHEPTGEVFDHAVKVYDDLEKEISYLHSLNEYLQNNFVNLGSIDIDEEIDQVLGGIYTLEDGDRIDFINENRITITKLINRGAIERETYIKAQVKVKKYINYNFSDEIKYVNEIAKLADYMGKNKHYPVWIEYLDDDYLNRSIKKINESKAAIEKYYYLVKKFEKTFPRFTLDNLETIVNQLQEYNKNSNLRYHKDYSYITQLKKRQQITDFNQLIEELRELVNIKNRIASDFSRYEKLTGQRYIAGEDPVSGIKKLVEYVKSIKIPEVKKHLIDFLGKKDISESVDNVDSRFVVLNLFVKSYRNLLEIHKELFNYLPLENHLHMHSILNDIMSAFKYFKEVFNSNSRLSEVVINKMGYVKFSQYLDIKQKLMELSDVEKSLVHNNEYRYLYGKYYIDVATNIKEVYHIIDFYQHYQELFKTKLDVYESLTHDRRNKLINIFDDIRTLSDSLSLNITTYNTIFKKALSISYYNNTFQEVKMYLYKLLNSSEELQSYLTFLSSLQVILKYKLNKLVGHLIVSDNLDHILNDFKYTYFQSLNDVYIKSNHHVSDSTTIINKLVEIKDLNKKLLVDNGINIAYKLRKQTPNKVTVKNIDSLNEYIERTSAIKKLYITDTTILNHYIAINYFDLVLIDDAHVGSSDDYGIAMRGKQVILAGVMPLQTLFAQDIISRMRNSNIVDFTKRLLPTPKQLTNYMDTANSLIKNEIADNYGVEVIDSELSDYIVKLLRVNENYHINIFSSNRRFIKEFYDELTFKFILDSRSEKEIIQLLTNNLNISDLSDEYLLKSDYNIIVLEDYATTNYDKFSTNLFDFLLQTNNKLVIYDNNKLLENNHDSMLINKLRILISSKSDIFLKEYKDELLILISKIFKKYHIACYSHHDQLDFLLSYKGKLSGIKIYFSNNISSFQMIEDYHETYLTYTMNGMKVYNVLLYDLSRDLDGIVKQIVTEITHGQD